LTIDEGKNEKYIRFENFLSGTSNEFIRRGATRSNVGVHVLHLQRLKNPIDFMRYVKGVVFPGKEFMIEKYLNQFTMHNAQCIIKEEESQTSANTLTWAKIKKKICILGRAKRQSRAMNYKLCIKYWWLWYPYRWWVALRAVLKLIKL
jgi:hypothetical protein